MTTRRRTTQPSRSSHPNRVDARPAPAPVPAVTPPPAVSGVRGRGGRLIERWTRARQDAGLPEPSDWDGPLVTMAISLLTGRGVREQGRRFAQGRRTLLTQRQIEQDLRLGLDALGTVSSSEDAATPRRWRPSLVDLGTVRAAALSGVRPGRQASLC